MKDSYIGVKSGRLSACPDKPNCVSTQADQEEKRMSPLPFTRDLETSKKHIMNVLGDMDRTKVEIEEDHYIHTVVTTKVLKFKDDVEFYFDPDERVIHFRSASRVGYSDFGVNKKRMQEISKKYEQVRRQEL
ncbi:DUF1499 domain-containing protein [Halobacillus sp. ACCC02827]|uniref:DUF1499 domain-containing protein n=1 Tax=Bacillaceae TaxID=186817 RepID=UPI0002A52270|nr:MULTISPECIES: DUF1499 domain-containing protein [Bacillaceae]ELK47597.1 hypothetical protein D479_05845 [Halobacillus sp. BAB-2008]QHT45913.1 DUF1499 domain-containing protein [Bacillus sp. SB49]WJE16720.1 DUF1499 domain-containing protein [Halobacillus sp. ACCC02827]